MAFIKLPITNVSLDFGPPAQWILLYCQFILLYCQCILLYCPGHLPDGPDTLSNGQSGAADDQHLESLIWCFNLELLCIYHLSFNQILVVHSGDWELWLHHERLDLPLARRQRCGGRIYPSVYFKSPIFLRCRSYGITWTGWVWSKASQLTMFPVSGWFLCLPHKTNPWGSPCKNRFVDLS